VFGFCAVLLLALFWIAIWQHRRGTEQEREYFAVQHVAGERSRRVLDGMTDGFASLDANWLFTAVNNMASQHLSRPREAFIGKSFWDVLPQFQGTAFEARIRESMEKHEPGTFVGLSPVTHRWISARFFPSDDGLNLFFHDQTKEREEEIKFRETAALHLAILQGAGYAVISTDSNGIVRHLNTAAESLTGYEAEGVVGQLNIADLFEVTERQARVATLTAELERPVRPDFDVLKAKAETWGIDRWDWMLSTRKGGAVAVEATVTRVADAMGHVTGFIFLLADITERKELQRSVEASRDTAIEQANAKSSFLANMSHEIRTPLNGVLGMGDLLSSTNLDESQREFVRILQVSGQTLLRVLDDVLDISKIDAGKMTIDPHPVDLAQSLREVMVLFSGKALEKGLRLTSAGFEQIPRPVLLDDVRVRQILGNLLSNAIKFTNEGSIEVGARLVAGDPAVVRISVIDQGVGISPDQVTTIFENFSQADSHVHRRYGGTGLGLTISKRLTELMGGRMGVQSVLGVGSTFWLELPLISPDPTAGLELGGVGGPLRVRPGLRVLLVEDDAVNAMVARNHLQRLRCLVTLAGNGQIAVDAMDDASFDVVLMDVHMPVLDGLSATRLIREKERSVGGHVPIVGVSASVLFEEVRACHDAGMDDVLSKPFTVGELTRCLAQNTNLWLRGTSRRESNPEGLGGAATPPRSL